VYSNHVNRADFKKLALTRLDDAKVLLKNRRYSAAYYCAVPEIRLHSLSILARIESAVAVQTKGWDWVLEERTN
jgi:hypothetical protein